MDIWSRPVATMPAFYAFQTPYPGLDYLQTYCVDAYVPSTGPRKLADASNAPADASYAPLCPSQS